MSTNPSTNLKTIPRLAATLGVIAWTMLPLPAQAERLSLSGMNDRIDELEQRLENCEQGIGDVCQGAPGPQGPPGPAGDNAFGPYTFSRGPSGDDDINDPNAYAVGSIWIDTSQNEAYILIDNTPGRAVWRLMTDGTGGNDAAPGSGPYSLSITVGGGGSGRVVSDPAGIDCGSQCDASFAGQTLVNLTAIPDANSEFGGWSSQCSGGTAVMNFDVSCTAAFAVKCDVLLQNCPAGQACYFQFESGTSVCTARAATSSPGLQGDVCTFLNECAAGYSCLLVDDPFTPEGLTCALHCDPATPSSGCAAAGTGLTCVRVNQFYAASPQIPDEIGMCVDCSVYPCAPP